MVRCHQPHNKPTYSTQAYSTRTNMNMNATMHPTEFFLAAARSHTFLSDFHRQQAQVMNDAAVIIPPPPSTPDFTTPSEVPQPPPPLLLPPPTPTRVLPPTFPTSWENIMELCGPNFSYTVMDDGESLKISRLTTIPETPEDDDEATDTDESSEGEETPPKSVDLIYDFPRFSTRSSAKRTPPPTNSSAFTGGRNVRRRLQYEDVRDAATDTALVTPSTVASEALLPVPSVSSSSPLFWPYPSW